MKNNIIGIFIILSSVFFVPSVSGAGISASMLKKNDVKRVAREIKKKADVNLVWKDASYESRPV